MGAEPHFQAPQVSGYELLALIGTGGSGSVYRARSLATGALVALKHVVSRSDDDLARFRHEAEIQARVRHENVLALLDVSMRPGELFLVTELADGSLRDLLDRTPQLPVGIALLLAREVLRGLAAAQAAQVLHRDVKPHNVLLLADGRVKVADFGVAKASQQTALTATGSVVGTPAYMSPEQALGQPLDARSDLFSVGTMLYEMLAGGNPWLADVPANTMRRILDVLPPPLGERDVRVPAGVERLVDRLLAKERTGRPASAADAVGLVEGQLSRLEDAPGLAAYLANPREARAALSRSASARHLTRAREFALAGTMAVEIPLWEAVLAVAHDPASAEARQLLATLAASSGYRVERLPANPHASDAANRLREDPDDVAALLRLAKAARIDRDFLRMMRLFHRLREIPVGDPYLEGQIASLVARDRPPSQSRVTAVPAVPSGPAVPAVHPVPTVPTGPAAPAPRGAPAGQSPPPVAPRSTVKPDPAKSRSGPMALDVARRAVTILVATPHLVAATLIGLALLIAGLTRLF